MKYKTIEAYSIEDLDLMVNEKLNAGWDLYGDLVVVVTNHGGKFYYQGMILMVEGDF